MYAVGTRHPEPAKLQVMTDQIILKPRALALASDGSAPDWVQLTPAGPTIHARDGRVFQLNNPEAVVAAFHENEADLPIDVEHASQERASKGLDAPAYGWIKDIEVREGALWGEVDWTAQGEEWVTSKAYRYLSPAFFHETDTGEMLAIIGAGLTNGPAFKMAALARAENSQLQKEDTMLEELLKELGLAKDASKEDALSAISTLKTDVATAKSALPDATKYVPRAQYDATVAQYDTTAAELKKLQDADAERGEAALLEAVEAGIEGGQILPASKDGFLATAKTMGLDDFKTFVDGLPKVSVARETPKTKTDTGVSTAGLSTEELAVAKALGQSPEDFAAAKAAEEGKAT